MINWLKKALFASRCNFLYIMFVIMKSEYFGLHRFIDVVAQYG